MAKVIIVPPDLTEDEMTKNKREFENFIASLIEERFGISVEIEAELKLNN